MRELDAHFPSDDGPARTLERISAGGRHLVTITRQRIADTLNALDDGDFREVHNHLSAAQQAIGPLAQAESYVAVADAQLMDTCDLKVGMVIVDIGEVTDIAVEEQCGMVRCQGHVTVKFGEHEYTWAANQQVYVTHETAEEG